MTNQKIDQFKDITLIIPTHNCPDFLNRNLSYLDSYKLPLDILISDSSTKENKIKNQQIINKLKYLNIIHDNAYPSNIKPFFKWYSTTKKAKTKYVALCADDDFLSLKGLKKSLHFLKQNKDYISVEGRNIYFINYPLSEKYSKFLFSWKEGDPIDCFEKDTISRFKKIALNYQFFIFGVHRKSELCNIFSKALETDSIEFPFGEYIFSFLTAIKGKVKRENYFYAARDKTIDFQRVKPQVNLIQEYIDDGSFKSRYNLFKKSIVEELSKHSKIDYKSADKIVDENMKIFFDYQRSRKYIIVLKRFFTNPTIYNNLAKIYILIKWLKINWQRKNKLKKIMNINQDYKRMKYFIKKFPIKSPPKKEKFIK